MVIEEEHAISTQKGPCLKLNPEPSCKVTVLTVPLCTTTLTALKENFTFQLCRKNLKWKVRLPDIIMACTRAYIFLWPQMILVSTCLCLCEWSECVFISVCVFVSFVVLRGGPLGIELMFSVGRGEKEMMVVKRKEEQTQSIDFHCVSLRA